MTEPILTIATLAGIQAFITMLVNLGKFLGIVKDGDAAKFNTALQTIVLAVLLIIGFFIPIDVPLVDVYAKQLADLGMSLMAIVPILMSLTPLFHDKALSGRLPILGFSHSGGDKTLKNMM